MKLAFESTSGARMVATRSLQLQVKKTMRSQKSLEGQLLMIRDGERTAISSRMAELDQIMPQYLGVSKAILESVIFCHQDESLWPMSQPAMLKKRFDEIFEAMKYTKAIDNIKVLRKKQKEELDKFKIIEAHAKDAKDKGAKAQKRSEELYDEMETLRNRNEQLELKISEAQERSEDAWNQAAKFEEIVSKLSGKRILASEKEQSVQSLKRHMREMTDSNEELQQMQDKYEERVALCREEYEAHRKQYHGLSQELDQARRNIGMKQSEVGKLQAQKDQYERQVRLRQSLIKETARSHNIRGFDLDITDEHVRDFMERISRLAREQNAAYERARRETQEDAQRAQQALNQLNQRRSALNQSKESSRTQITSNDRKNGGLQAELNKIEIDEGGKVVLESTIQEIETKLESEKSSYELAEWDNKIQSADNQLTSLDKQKERLDSELIEATRQAGDSAQLDFVRKELQNRQQALQTNTGAYGQRIAVLLGSGWKPETIEHDFLALLDDKSSAVQDAIRQRDGTSRELEQIQFKLRTASDELTSKQQSLKENEKIVRNSIDDDPSEYPFVLQELETSLNTLNTDKTSTAVMKNWYVDCLDTLEKSGGCRLCRRAMRNDKEREKFLQILQDTIKKAELAEPKELDHYKTDYENTIKVRPNYEAYLRIQEEIPGLETARQLLEHQRGSLIAQLEAQDQKVSDCESARKEVEMLQKTVQLIQKCHDEIVKFGSQVIELVKKQQQAGKSRGLEEIQGELKQINDQVRTVNAHLTELRTDKERSRNRLTSLELERRDLQSKLSTAVYQLKEKTGLLKQVEDLQGQNQEQRHAIRKIEAEIQALSPRIAQAQTQYDDITERGEQRSRELQKDAARLSDSLNQLKSADQEISAFIDRGGPQQLSQATREISGLEEEIARIETEQRHVTVAIKKIEDEMRNHSETKRAITDNLMYRENVRHLQSLKAEIQELEAYNAEADKDRYDREGHRWQNERNKLTAEQATIIGNVRSKDDQLAQLLKDWETDYKDAPFKYKEAHIKVETTKAAIEDLGRYGGALDKAIMKYHSLKMEEINHIIEELWRKTYQGTDVDTIQIRSENETQKSNKSYNYRVVMVKQDAEMDMRGRCSAGQKVLASIIIRLALAECFGVNCGLIALDEPTTNLDRDNIRALAESLAEIIRLRRQQANFQLIVITHDEEFLRYMNCADFADHYYRVSRNDKQKSTIERQSVAEVCLPNYGGPGIRADFPIQVV